MDLANWMSSRPFLRIRSRPATAMIHQLNVSKRSIGVTFNASQEAEITLWAPWATTVAVKRYRDSAILPLTSHDNGYWQLTTNELAPGDLYSFVLNELDIYADPASLAQPQGLYGPSQAVSTVDFYWEDTCWVNPPADEYLIHPIDLPTFTPEGTLNSVIGHLPGLKKRGITAISIRPLTPFSDASGKSVTNDYLFAIPPTFGGYRQLQHLVNACHYEGIAVVMTVGCPTTYHQQIKHVSADMQQQARQHFLIENILMWFRDFHIDAIRLEVDQSCSDAPTLPTDIRECTNALTAKDGHHYYLLVEQEMASDASEKTYRNDCLYDEPYAHTLHELFHK